MKIIIIEEDLNAIDSNKIFMVLNKYKYQVVEA